MTPGRTTRWLVLFAAITVLLSTRSSATAQPVIAFQWLPGVNSNQMSRHNDTGPVLAGDFIPSVSGAVVQVDWWGTAPLTGLANNDSWEITIHNNAAGVPAVTLPTGGISQHFLNAPGIGPGPVWMYSVLWNPMDVAIVQGTNYWFSVANASGPGWNWANPLAAAPEIGAQAFSDVVSVGGNPSQIGGPHDGPWAAVFPNQDFAFRIWVTPVPEPSTFVLCGLGILAAGLRRSVRHRTLKRFFANRPRLVEKCPEG